MASAGSAWRVAQLRPGSNPIRSLAKALAAPGTLFTEPQAGGIPVDQVVEATLEMSSLGLQDICQQARLAEGVKLLVIACNTASSAMLRDARERYTEARGIPVVEVIHPAVRAAVRQTRTKRIGVIGTVGTINSRAYDDAFIAASDLEIFSQGCPRFVEFVESGVTSGAELFAVAEEYLAPLKAANIDTLVLGCTHYPLLAGAIQYVMGEDVTLVSSAEETAYDVYRTLVKHGLERTSAEPPTYRFEATGDSKNDFLRLASRFLGPEVNTVDLVQTGTIPLQHRGMQ